MPDNTPKTREQSIQSPAYNFAPAKFSTSQLSEEKLTGAETMESEQQVTGPPSNVIEQKDEQKDAAEDEQTEKRPPVSFPVVASAIAGFSKKPHKPVSFPVAASAIAGFLKKPHKPVSFSVIASAVAGLSKKNGLIEQQVLLETKVMEEMEAMQLEVDQLQDEIEAAKTEEEKAFLATQSLDRQRELDKVRADFEKNNAEFDKKLQAEMARRAEFLKERREAAKVCKRLTA